MYVNLFYLIVPFLSLLYLGLFVFCFSNSLTESSQSLNFAYIFFILLNIVILLIQINTYMKVCLNCGREHEGRLVERFRDGDNKPIEIVVCQHARYETDDEGQIDGDN